MKTLGIVGGIAPESTIVYYRAIVAEFQRRVSDGTQPAVIINSIDMKKMLDLIGAKKLDEVTEYLAAEMLKLVGAGVQFAFYASNTPHVVFDGLRKRFPIPLLSIVECAAAEAKKLGLKRLGLLGTRFTMQAPFYPDVFAREGLAIVAPRSADQEIVHEKYMGELIKAGFKLEAGEAVLAVIDRMIVAENIDGVVLGGTELPLLLRAANYNGLLLLDTSVIHAQAAVDEMLRN